jgi:16S rRNA (cytosine1402-N4)-methyltransferase
VSAGGHRPVMLEEVLTALNPRDGAIYIDGTFGGGGYSRAILEAADCRVCGIDCDADACDRGKELAADYAGRLTILQGRFGDMERLTAAEGIGPVDGVTLDLGVSSFQIDQPERGFSFSKDGPLDMRMGGDGPSAADIVNSESEQALADIIYRFGEERLSRRIAKAIVAARSEETITRTTQLAKIVRGCYPTRGGPSRSGKDMIDPATRTFQALRIYVNDELGELSRGLVAAENILGEGGRLAVVSFHSLEDRIAKQFLRERSGAMPSASRHAPQIQNEAPAPSFALMVRRAIRPGKTEIQENPRSRSARLRTAERTGAPAWTAREGGAT